MAFGRKTLVAAAEPPEKPKSLVASAIRTNITDLSYNLWKFRDEGWQRELWRYYDIVPEFSFAARWVGACCSKVRIYVAEVDKLGRVQGEVKDAKINALAESLLGGPARKAELLRNLGVNLTVAGEAYIVGRPGDDGQSANPKDQWYVLSSTEMRRVQSANGEWQWAWYLPDGNPFTLDLDRNVITRVWTPHPSRVWCADAPARACHQTLRQMEQLVKYTASQLDSRLAGAGLLIIPNDMDLPLEPNVTSQSDSLMIRLATAMAQSLRGEGSALGILPHIVEAADPEKFKHITFETPLSKEAPELYDNLVNKLGVGLDMPPEVLTGQGSANHWCLSVDTEILTQNQGWVKYDQLQVGDLVMTLDHETGTSEWQEAQAVNVFDVEDEKMLALESPSHSSLSTTNHRWPLLVSERPLCTGKQRIWTTSGEGFPEGAQLTTAAPYKRLPEDTDGCCKILPQLTEQEYEQLLAPDWNDAVAVIERLSADQLASLLGHLVTLHKFGGIVQKPQWADSTYTFIWSDVRDLAAIERIAILAGYAVRWGTHATGPDTVVPQLTVVYHPTPLNVAADDADAFLRFAGPNSVLLPNMEKVRLTWTTYTGKVWCPTTANGTWLARRNGKVFYTGNSGYLVEGNGIKIHIEPLMNRICDALTAAYLAPALRLMGKDPSRYTYSFDTSPLVLRPQRLTDALNLYEKGELSGDALRDAGYFKESDAPTVEEAARRLLQEILLRDPQLLQNQAIREAVGIPEDIISQESMIAPTPMSVGLGPEGGGVGPPPPPPPPTGIQSELPPPMPDTFNEGTNPSPVPPTGIQASVATFTREEVGVLILAEATVRRGLELAGKRLLDKDTRNHFSDVPAFELHTRIRVADQARVNRLLIGAWDQLGDVITLVSNEVDTPKLQKSLSSYCSKLLLAGEHHDPDQLLAHLRKDGVIGG